MLGPLKTPALLKTGPLFVFSETVTAKVVSAASREYQIRGSYSTGAFKLYFLQETPPTTA
jgi:hypothetical protein